MKPQRRTLLGTALVGTLAASLLLAVREPDGPAPVVALPATTTHARATAPGAGAEGGEGGVGWPAPSAPALAAWGVPPPAAAPASPEASPEAAGDAAQAPAVSDAPAAVPEPVAPPLPWRWIGRLDDRSGPQALLEGAAGAQLVRPQETVDGAWRLEAVQPDALRWTWLPGGLPVVQHAPAPGAPA